MAVIVFLIHQIWTEFIWAGSLSYHQKYAPCQDKLSVPPHINHQPLIASAETPWRCCITANQPIIIVKTTKSIAYLIVNEHIQTTFSHDGHWQGFGGVGKNAHSFSKKQPDISYLEPSENTFNQPVNVVYGTLNVSINLWPAFFNRAFLNFSTPLELKCHV